MFSYLFEVILICGPEEVQLRRVDLSISKCVTGFLFAAHAEGEEELALLPGPPAGGCGAARRTPL